MGKAQHTEDGNYYVSLDDLSDTAAVYAILSRSADAAARDPWSLLELSPEPLFRDDGTRIGLKWQNATTTKLCVSNPDVVDQILADWCAAGWCSR